MPVHAAFRPAEDYAAPRGRVVLDSAAASSGPGLPPRGRWFPLCVAERGWYASRSRQLGGPLHSPVHDRSGGAFSNGAHSRRGIRARPGGRRSRPGRRVPCSRGLEGRAARGVRSEAVVVEFSLSQPAVVVASGRSAELRPFCRLAEVGRTPRETRFRGARLRRPRALQATAGLGRVSTYRMCITRVSRTTRRSGATRHPLLPCPRRCADARVVRFPRLFPSSTPGRLRQVTASVYSTPVRWIPETLAKEFALRLEQTGS